ncbi:MAG: hypothetical protein ACOX5G_09025 [Kiritimatiellia bacterium]
MNICKTIGKTMFLSGGLLSFFAILCYCNLIKQVPPFVNLVLSMIAVVDILLGIGFLLAGKRGKKSIGEKRGRSLTLDKQQKGEGKER